MEYLRDLVIIPSVRTRPIVRERFRTGEFVIAGRGSDYVALAGYLSCKPCDRSSHLIYFRKEHDARETSLRVIRDCRMEEEDTWEDSATAIIQ